MMVMISFGTPNSAAGSSRKENKFKKLEIGWRKAQDKLNSSLL